MRVAIVPGDDCGLVRQPKSVIGKARISRKLFSRQGSLGFNTDVKLTLTEKSFKLLFFFFPPF